MEGEGSAKRLKSANGTPISAPIRVTPTASLPRYQPPDSASVSSATLSSLSRTHSAGTPSLKFTVKAAPSKLRQATSGRSESYEDEQVTQPAGRSVRSTRNPRTVVEPDSDDDEDDDQDMEDAEDDLEPELTAEGYDDEDEDMDEEEEDDDDDAEGEEDDEIAASHPPPPRIQQTTAALGKPKVKVSAPSEGALQSVEDKELGSSDLDSEEEGMDTTLNPDDDDDLDDDDDDDLDNDSEGDNSQSATPDPSKLTRRQRGPLEEEENAELIALSNEPGKRKIITEAEHVMRRQEMARRRKNLSEKRNEEEKQETIDRLLKKPAPKRRTRAEMLAAQLNSGTPAGDDESEDIKPDPVFTRWVSSQDGSRLGVPIEWLQSPAADMLARPEQLEKPGEAQILVEEVA